MVDSVDFAVPGRYPLVPASTRERPGTRKSRLADDIADYDGAGVGHSSPCNEPCAYRHSTDGTRG